MYPDSVLLWAFEDDICHVVTSTGDRTYLSRAELIDDPDAAPLSAGFSSFSPRLDYLINGSTLTTEDLGNNNTRVTFPTDSPLLNPTKTLVLISTSGVMAGTFVTVSYTHLTLPTTD